MGKDYPGTHIPKTFADRLQKFHCDFEICSQRRVVYEFGNYIFENEYAGDDEGGPDLDNAVSTLVVHARPSEIAGAPK